MQLLQIKNLCRRLVGKPCVNYFYAASSNTWLMIAVALTLVVLKVMEWANR